MKYIFAVAIILLVSGCTMCQPVETTEEMQTQNAEVGDKGICGDKVCSGTESSTNSANYCKQDCYPG